MEKDSTKISYYNVQNLLFCRFNNISKFYSQEKMFKFWELNSLPQIDLPLQKKNYSIHKSITLHIYSTQTQISIKIQIFRLEKFSCLMQSTVDLMLKVTITV